MLAASSFRSTWFEDSERAIGQTAEKGHAWMSGRRDAAYQINRLPSDELGWSYHSPDHP